MDIALPNVNTGQQVQWKLRIWRVVGWYKHDVVVLRDIGSETVVAAPLAEVTEPQDQVATAAGVPLEEMTEEQWLAEVKKFERIKALAESTERDGSLVRSVAKEFGVHRSQVYRWINIYRESPCVQALQDDRPGRKPGSRFLLKEREELIANLIGRRWLRRPPIHPRRFVKLVQRVFRRLGLKPPCKKAIEARLRPFLNYQGEKKRLGSKLAKDRLGMAIGSHEVLLPLDEVQLDHTLIDLILVTADQYRDCIGRAWLTLAIDVCTRLIVGYYFDYNHPDTYSVGQSAAHCMLDKAPLLKAMGIHDVTWAAQGKVKKFVLDRAMEHRTLRFRRTCNARGIDVVLREKPSWGDYIERAIGTQVRNFHAIPGTTRSSVKDRADYDSGKNACLTFEEANEFIVNKICKYNHDIHSALDESPWHKWRRLFSTGEPAVYVPPTPLEDPRQFLFDVMPSGRCTVQRDGIHALGGRFASPELETWIHNHERPLYLYNRASSNQIYLPITGRKEPLVVPRVGDYDPWFSQAEWKVRSAARRIRGYDPKEQALSDKYDERGEQIVDNGGRLTNAAKKKRAMRDAEAVRTRGLIDSAWQTAYRAPGVATSADAVNDDGEDDSYADVSDIPVAEAHSLE